MTLIETTPFRVGDTVIIIDDPKSGKYRITRINHEKARLGDSNWHKLANLQLVYQDSFATDTRSWPYTVKDGRLAFLFETKTDGIQTRVIADFAATITGIVETEQGDIWQVAGDAVRRGKFTLEVPAEVFADDQRLKKAIDAASGPLDPVRARMGGHLGPAIQILSNPDEITRTKRFYRTGWKDGAYIIPGTLPENTSVELPQKLPYMLKEDADIEAAKNCLAYMLDAMNGRGALCVTFALQAAASKLMGWQNERYALFIRGRTGSLKTSFAQVVMSMYGKDFLDDVNLIKFGEGATRNAMMQYATSANDAPILLDNFKPNTGRGNRDFVNMIHNILEGGEKDRLNRDSKLRQNRIIDTWPIITGEDVPDTDPASLARVLVVPFDMRNDTVNIALASAQEIAHTGDFTAIVRAWIEWLQTDEAQAKAATLKSEFVDRRQEWASRLKEQQPDMVNIMRVASNLTTNAMTWELMCACPTLAAVLDEKYNDAYTQALEEVAGLMAENTLEALEGERYISALRELLAAGRISLAYFGGELGIKCVGWFDERSAGAYILPAITRKEIEDALGRDALNGISNSALYAQLEENEYLVRTGSKKTTIQKWINNGNRRVLHLSIKAIGHGDSTPST